MSLTQCLVNGDGIMYLFCATFTFLSSFFYLSMYLTCAGTARMSLQKIFFILDYDYVLLARAFAERRHRDGVFRPGTSAISAKCKRQVDKKIFSILKTQTVSNATASKLRSCCPRSLLKKVRLLKILENRTLLNPPTSDSSSAVLISDERSFSAIADEPFDSSTAQHTPEIDRNDYVAAENVIEDAASNNPESVITFPVAVNGGNNSRNDLSAAVSFRALKPRDLLSDWAAHHAITRGAVTDLLQRFRMFCPKIDFRNLPATAPTLMKVRNFLVTSIYFAKQCNVMYITHVCNWITR